MKSLVFPRIFLHCVALGFIVSGLLLRVRPGVRIPSGAPKNTVIPRNCGVFLFEKFRTKQNKEYLILRHCCLWHTQIHSKADTNPWQKQDIELQLPGIFGVLLERLSRERSLLLPILQHYSASST